MTAYLQTWTDGATAALEQAGEPLVHAASNQYDRMGVAPDDTLYVAYLDQRHLHLLGRLTVDRILDQREVERLFGGEVWVADYHAIGSGTDLALFDVRVPVDVLEALTFARNDGSTTTLAVAPDGIVNGQRLQSIRRLTSESAALLDEVLDVGIDPEPGSGQFREADPAVEQHAMDVVRAHYESNGWTVEDVSAHRPYDFVCQNGDTEVHVEVKGLSGAPVRIHLTANEVEHAHPVRTSSLPSSPGSKRLIPDARGPSGARSTFTTRGSLTRTDYARPSTATDCDSASQANLRKPPSENELV